MSAQGGGGGGTASYTPSDTPEQGRDGGSGGGGAYDYGFNEYGAGGAGAVGEGNDGGNAGFWGGAGGGGADGTGADGLDDYSGGNNGGSGGPGQASAITGSSVTYAAGGDGGDGGDAGDPRSNGANGAPNTGNGGGGADGNNGGPAVEGGTGGSGIVVVRYTPPGTVPDPLLEYRMDEEAWNGTSGEVTDASPSAPARDGTAQGGATTSNTNPPPARAGDPGTCRYGEFDGADDYVEVSNFSNTLDGTATLTFWIHTTQVGNDTGWQAPGVTGVEEAGGSDDIMWGWIDASGRIGISVGNDFDQEQKSTTAINDGAWHHVALTRDAATGDTKVYVDGVLENSGTTGAGTIGTPFSSFGRIEDTGGSPEHFAGRLDELRVYGDVLTDSDVRSVRDATHPCPVTSFCPAGSAFSDSFEDGTLDPWQAQGGGNDAGVNADTADDGTLSAFLRGNGVRLRSPTVDLSAASSASVSAWIRRGDDAFSEDPDFSEDLRFEYRNNSNSWIVLDTYAGAGTPGEIFEPSFTLPVDALHANFRLRFVHEGGDNGDFDYWHVDSVCVTASGGLAHYAISHSGTLVSCDQETVTITAHDTGDNPVDAGNATIDLSIDTGEGTWARVITGSGTLADPTAGDGAGSYTFPDNGETGVELAFNYTSVSAGNPETVNIDVIDGGGTAEDGAEDPDLTVSHSGFRFTDGSGNPINLPDQIAAKPSDTAPGAQSLALQAIRTSDTDPAQCVPAFPDGTAVEVEMGAECRNPATCAGNELAVTNDGNTTAIDTSDDDGVGGAPSYEAVNLTFGSNAEAPLTLAYPDAGALQLHARANPIDDGTGTPPVVQYITGSSNDFVVRPLGFYLDFDPDHPDGDTVFDDRAANAACADQTSCAADADGDVFATAGVDFPVRIEAVVWQPGDDGDDNGVPDSNQALADNDPTPNFGQEAAAETVDLDRTLVAPAGDPGALGGGQNIGDPNDQAFSNGSIVANGVSWDEVGIIDLAAALSDGRYLDIAVGAAVGEDATGLAPNLGRFIPARLEATGNAPAFEPFCDVGTDFTYLDQAFGYATDPRVTVTAFNANGGVTANYGAAFWKLPVAPTPIFPGRDYTDATTSSATLDDDRGATNVTWADGGSDSLNGQDTATIAGERLTYQRNGPEAPFGADVDLRIPAGDLTDADGVCNTAGGTCNTGAGGTGDDLVFDGIGGTRLRFGRLRIDDAFGPEIAPVEQQWRIEFWTGNTWASNNLPNDSADDCTRLILADDVDLEGRNMVAGNERVELNEGAGAETVIDDDTLDVTSGGIVFMMGEAVVQYAAPEPFTDDSDGWIDVRATLAADFPHLLIDRDGDGDLDADDNPQARVTFGIFAGEREHIYLRELFPAP